jgi:hypothetical protein
MMLDGVFAAHGKLRNGQWNPKATHDGYCDAHSSRLGARPQ